MATFNPGGYVADALEAVPPLVFDGAGMGGIPRLRLDDDAYLPLGGGALTGPLSIPGVTDALVVGGALPVSIPAGPIRVYLNNTSGATRLAGIFFGDQPTAGSLSIQGVEGYARTTNPDGAVSLSIGAIGNIEHDGLGTLTAARAVQGGGIIRRGSVTTWASLYAANPGLTAGASVGTQYGVYVEPVTRGATRYEVYAPGTAASHFGGALQVASVASVGDATVGGALSVTGIIAGASYRVGAVEVLSAARALSVASINSSGDAVVGGVLGVTGTASVGGVYTTGNAYIGGTATIGTLSIATGVVQAPIFIVDSALYLPSSVVYAGAGGMQVRDASTGGYTNLSAAALSGTSLSLSGAATVGGALSVTGLSTLGDLTVGGLFNLRGAPVERHNLLENYTWATRPLPPAGRVVIWVTDYPLAGGGTAPRLVKWNGAEWEPVVKAGELFGEIGPGQLGVDSVVAGNVDADAITGREISGTQLSAIFAELGEVTTALVRNADGSIHLETAGVLPEFIKHPRFKAMHAGGVEMTGKHTVIEGDTDATISFVQSDGTTEIATITARDIGAGDTSVRMEFANGNFFAWRSTPNGVIMSGEEGGAVSNISFADATVGVGGTLILDVGALRFGVSGSDTTSRTAANIWVPVQYSGTTYYLRLYF